MTERNHRITAIFVLLMCGADAANASDTWVALPNATKDGFVILAKNGDRPPVEAPPMVQIPHHAATGQRAEK